MLTTTLIVSIILDLNSSTSWFDIRDSGWCEMRIGTLTKPMMPFVEPTTFVRKNIALLWCDGMIALWSITLKYHASCFAYAYLVPVLCYFKYQVGCFCVRYKYFRCKYRNCCIFLYSQASCYVTDEFQIFSMHRPSSVSVLWMLLRGICLFSC